MIAKLTGRLDSSGAGHAVIDVGGVGYLVEASARTLDALGAVGSDVTVHTEMLVGEDFLRLLGFARAEERDWFRLLTSVQGVGTKVALAILSALEIGELQRSEEHTSELQSLMRISYAVFCLQKKKNIHKTKT